MLFFQIINLSTFCILPIIIWLALLYSVSKKYPPLTTNLQILPWFPVYTVTAKIFKSWLDLKLSIGFEYMENTFTPTFVRPSWNTQHNWPSHPWNSLFSWFPYTIILVISFVSLWRWLRLTSLLLCCLSSWVFFVSHSTLSPYMSSFIAMDWSTISMLKKPTYIFFSSKWSLLYFNLLLYRVPFLSIWPSIISSSSC